METLTPDEIDRLIGAVKGMHSLTRSERDGIIAKLGAGGTARTGPMDARLVAGWVLCPECHYCVPPRVPCWQCGWASMKPVWPRR